MIAQGSLPYADPLVLDLDGDGIELTIAQIEELGEELLDFSSMQDLIAWLQLR